MSVLVIGDPSSRITHSRNGEQLIYHLLTDTKLSILAIDLPLSDRQKLANYCIIT